MVNDAEKWLQARLKGATAIMIVSPFVEKGAIRKLFPMPLGSTTSAALVFRWP